MQRSTVLLMALMWGILTMPAAPIAHTESIGTHANGCIKNAEALPLDGTGYQVIRPSRERYYGHPMSIEYIQDMGKRFEEEQLGIALIADIGTRRGGPVSGHASHEIGLDIDIWFRLLHTRLSCTERETVLAVAMTSPKAERVNGNWNDTYANMVRIAAHDPRVARIFVHPSIKRDLCERTWSDRSWLSRVRPWYGHTAHFHVRLRCPDNSPQCANQAPPPPGEGCDTATFKWWSARLKQARPPRTPSPPRPSPQLPAACIPILNDNE